MGSNSSKIEEFINKSFPVKDYDILDRKFDSIYGGEIQLIKNKQNSQDVKLMKEYNYIEMNSIETEIENLEKLISINNKCPHFLKIYGYTQSKDSLLCGKIQKIYIIFESCELTLRDEFENRMNKTTYFEKDYLKFIETGSQALKHLKEYGIPYDSLKLSLIFKTPQSDFKFLFPKLYNVMPNYMEFLRSFNKEDFFLSPEALQNIKDKCIFINFDQYKSDVFVLGCLVLELMEKISCSDINLQDVNLHKKIITKALESVKKEYSESFFNILKEMLEENPQKRVGFNELLLKISPQKPKNQPQMPENPIIQEKTKIRLTKNKNNNLNHVCSLKEFSYNTDETLKKFDESKKTLMVSPISKSAREIKQYPNSSQFPDNSNYDLVEEVFPDGSIYKGEKLNSKRHGKGKFIYSDGGVYEGDWKLGRMDGYGALYYADHSIAYEGEWKADKFEGRGILYNEKNSIDYSEKSYDLKNLDNLNNHWVKYEGSFMEDKKEGSGILFFPNGDKISGTFSGDKLSGKNCILYKKKGEVVKGEWKDNKLIKLN